MADEKKAGSLILNQLGMFNEAVIFFGNTVEPAILAAFDKVVENFANERNWDGEFDLEGDDNECWLSPSGWKISEPGKDTEENKAWFEVDSRSDNEDYWTALFCRQASAGGEAGFVFNVNHKKFNGKNAWNAYSSNIDSDLITELDKNGFKNLGKGKFFLPIHLNADKLVAAWEKCGNEKLDDFVEDECFEPLNDALEKLESTWEVFDKIINGFTQLAGKSIRSMSI
jgi:hypothetical protein